MATTVPHKRGDTFLFSAVLRETKTGPATDLGGWQISSMIRDEADRLIDEVTISVTDAEQGAYTLRVNDTTRWPAGMLYWDIQYTDPTGIIRSTETIALSVIEDVTYPDAEPAP